MLDKLPLELQRMVLDLIVDQRDLKSLCEVSKSFHNIVVPSFYRTAKIVTRNQYYEDRDIVQPLLSTLIYRPTYAQYIKTIHIGDPRRARRSYHEIQQYYCEHDAGVFGNEEEEDDEPLVDLIAEFGSSVLDLLYKLRENSLEGFHWHLGSCIPASLLGENAYLPLKQSRIKSLSITKDPSCWHSNIYSLDLTRFRSLQTVSWRGLSQVSDFIEVGDMLRCNAKHLQDLEFDVEEPRGTSLIQSLIIRQSPVLETPIMLNSLRNLCLKGAAFRSIDSNAILAWNVSRLASLTLNECPEVGEFLTTSIKIVQLALKSFELVTCRKPLGSPGPLDKFLRSFQSLKILHLSIDARSLDMDTIWVSIAHHQSTLRELVLNSIPTSFDVPFDGVTLPDLDTDVLELEFLGLNCRPSDAKSRCHLIPGGQNLKMLHIRRGLYDGCLDLVNDKYDIARDLDEFGNWVFGPNGLPKLDFVAYGNFTASSRLGSSRKVFRRPRRPPATSPDHHDEPQVGYENIPDEEIDLSHDLSRFLASLEACPLDE